MGEIVAYQEEFRQALPIVTGNADYKIFRKTLERITELIRLSKIDRLVMAEAVRVSQQQYDLNRQAEGKQSKRLTNKEKIRIQQRARQVVRCGIARHLTGDAYREFSCRLADSAVLQHFCLIDRLQEIKVPSKSKLQRDEALFEEGFLREIITFRDPAGRPSTGTSRVQAGPGSWPGSQSGAVFSGHDVPESQHPLSGRLGAFAGCHTYTDEGGPAHPR